MGGGSGDTKLYSVLGDGEEVNSLFADDDMFLDDNGWLFFFFFFFLIIKYLIAISKCSSFF